MTRHDPLPADLLYIAHIKYANIVSSDLPLCPRFRNMVVKAQSEGIGRSGWRLAWPVLHEPLRSRLYPLKLSAKCQRKNCAAAGHESKQCKVVKHGND